MYLLINLHDCRDDMSTAGVNMFPQPGAVVIITNSITRGWLKGGLTTDPLF